MLTASDKHTPTDTTQNTPTNTHILPITSTNNIKNDKSPKLPHLQGANYAPWNLALRMYAFEIDATEHLSGNPQVLHEAVERKQHETKQNRLLGAVLSNVSMDILGLILAPEETSTAHELISKIINHINQNTKEDHKFVVEAEIITLDPDGIDEFIDKHLEVRQKMVAARYPSIMDETTTIDFLLAGLKKQSAFTLILV